MLAHEIGHISDKDIEKEIRKQAGLGATFNVGLMVAEGSGEINSGQARALSQLGEASWDILISKGLSKEDEYEADQFGVQYIARMGYDPQALKSFLSRLLPMEKGKGARVKILMSTHPKPSKRIANLDKFMVEKGYSGMNLPDHETRYLEFKKSHPIP